MHVKLRMLCIATVLTMPSIAPKTALGQGFGADRSLGGYGASEGLSGAAMGGSGGGTMIIPYGGMFAGFAPGRMPGSSSLAFRPRGISTNMGSARAPFILSPMSGGMSEMSAGSPRRRMTGLGGPGTTGLGRTPGPGRMNGMRGASGLDVMPPRIGYPFRQPPSLLAPPTPGAGMSM